MSIFRKLLPSKYDIEDAIGLNELLNRFEAPYPAGQDYNIDGSR